MSDKKLDFGPLAGRVALVTGASRGYGAAIAKRLARSGAHVIMLARTVSGLEAVDDEIRGFGGKATLIPFDLLKLDEIANLGPLLFDRFGRLDMLVANAAMLGHLGPVAHFDGKVWDRVVAVNLTANHRLIQTLDPLLRVGDHGRAIFVTDGSAEAMAAYGGAYAVSKTALDKMVALYAAETRTTRLRVNTVDPGPLRTNLRGQQFPGEDREKLPGPDARTDIFVALGFNDCQRHGEIIRLASA